MLFGLYRHTSRLLSPAVVLWLKKRQREGKEDKVRVSERTGHASFPRPKGPLVWVHAASVGESMSILPFIDGLLARYPDISVLLTTVTVTSAKVMESRLPDRAYHQYMPVDTPGAVRRFVRHWTPDTAIFVESELWPNLIRETHKTGCPLVLLNARLSEKSYKTWQRLAGTARGLVQCFSLILAQSQADAERFRALGAADARYIGNLKYFALPLPSDAKETGRLLSMIGQRYVWLAASTHPGEEEMVAEAHKHIAESFGSLLTIIVPRHASRGEGIQDMLEDMKLKVSRRSAEEPIADDTNIYLADTMGELGMLYRLTGIVFMGGTLADKGGQNPLEAARLNCAIILGPHMENFAAIAREMEEHDACVRARNPEALADMVTTLLRDTERQEKLARAAETVVKGKKELLEQTLEALDPFLEKKATRAPHAGSEVSESDADDKRAEA